MITTEAVVRYVEHMQMTPESSRNAEWGKAAQR
jgi:hypothetical protein